MEQYLMMLYVTLEQETALKKFFIDQGWAYCKPDLSVTTDKLGSATITTTPDTGDDSETATSVTGKRKARAISKGAPKVKYVKVLTSPMVSQSGTGNVHQNSIEIQNKDVSESENQLHIPANEQLLFHDNTQNEGDDIENADYVVKTERTIGDIVDEYIEEAEIEDVGDDENDDTDMDDNMEVIEGDTENVLDEPEFGTKFNPGKKSHAEDKGHGKKETLQQNKQKITNCSYSCDDMENAHTAVKNRQVQVSTPGGVSQVPKTSQKKHVQKEIVLPCGTWSHRMIFTKEQELKLIKILKNLLKDGEVMTQGFVCAVGSVYATKLGLKPEDHILSTDWFRRFRNTWESVVTDLFPKKQQQKKKQKNPNLVEGQHHIAEENCLTTQD